MTATTIKNDIAPPKRFKKSTRIYTIAAIGFIVFIVGSFIYWSTHDEPEPPVQPYATQIEELTKRGFTDIRHEADVYEPRAERFYGMLDTCRVRLQRDSEGLYAVIVDDYRVLDPTEALLRQDTRLKPCFSDAQQPPTINETVGAGG